MRVDFQLKAGMERLAFAGGEQECCCWAVVSINEQITLLAPYSVPWMLRQNSRILKPSTGKPVALRLVSETRQMAVQKGRC